MEHIGNFGGIILPISTILIVSFIIYKGKLVDCNNFGIICSCVFMIYWILFLNVNPSLIPAHKDKILSYIPKQHSLDEKMLSKQTNLKNLKYPVIFKPTICTGISRSVALIKNITDANEYIKVVGYDDILIQKFVEYKNEVAVLYEKNPFTGRGNIISMVSKISNNYEIMPSCRSGIGVKCVNLTDQVTRKLVHVIDKISNRIPDFNIGRYDIKYKDLKSLMRGEDFYVLEINGVMGYDMTVFDDNLMGKIKSFQMSVEWEIRRFIMGFKNIITFQGFNIFELISSMSASVIGSIECKNWERLFCG